MLIFCKTSEDDSIMQRAAAIVSCERRRKAFRLPGRRARANSLAAELLARYALEQYGLGSDMLYFDKTGRPRVRDDAAYLSLSHSGEYVACAVSDKIIGVDIQKIKPVGRLVAARVCTAAEQREIKEASDSTRAFIRLWTLKEAWRKANPDANAHEMLRAEFSVGDDLSVQGPQGFSYRINEEIDGYIIAECEAKEK